MAQPAEQKVEEFFSSYHPRHFKKGQGLLFIGENINAIYKIDSGRVGQYNISAEGQKTMLNVFKPPAFFPLAYALRDMPSPHFFEAMADSTIRVAPTKDVLKFLLANSDVLYDLLVRLYSGIDGMQQRLMLMASGDAASRVVLELSINADRFGVNKSGQSVVLPLTETELALSAGLSRETVSREISKLRERGLVSISHNEIKIPDISAIKALVSV